MTASMTLDWPLVGWPRFDTTVRLWRRPLSLRVDVDHAVRDLEVELDKLHQRLQEMGVMVASEKDEDLLPGFRVYSREADGELYVYVEDIAAKRLAGYTVFSRLVELDRHADRILRAPHTKIRAAYQRRGLATTIYRRALDQGQCLITGARQSVGAHGLWQALSGLYAHFYVDLRDKRVTYLGDNPQAQVRGALHTRWILLGRNREFEAVATQLQMEL